MGRWFEWQIWHLCVWLAEFGRNRSSRITMIPMIYPQSNMAGWEVYYKWQLSGEHHLCIGLSCLSCLIARGQINPLRCPPDFGVHFMNWNSVNRKSCWSVLSNGMIGIIMNRLGYGLGKKKWGSFLGISSTQKFFSVSENPYFDCNMMIHECFGTLFSEARLVPWCVVAAPPRVLWILGV